VPPGRRRSDPDPGRRVLAEDGQNPATRRLWRVLVVDDFEDTAQWLARNFRRLGHDGCVAYDGKKLVEQTGTGTVELGTVDPKSSRVSWPRHGLDFRDFRANKPREIVENIVPFASPQPEELQQKYGWELRKETRTEIWLEAKPRTKSAKRLTTRFRIILDRTELRPKAVQRIDPGGIETVFVFSHWLRVVGEE